MRNQRSSARIHKGAMTLKSIDNNDGVAALVWSGVASDGCVGSGVCVESAVDLISLIRRSANWR